ncbi:hypothetical protein GJV26_18275 [Massilia dura]|uniref:Mutator family transposase n=1 Tax=Pseudoduganella dura TaxID=321982 RepID=A0A6I3XL61_9BURK|nr:hypothetical protein [Pseudoduganella dura]
MIRARRKGAEADFIRQTLQHALQRLMEMDVEALCQAAYCQRSDDRVNSRNGYCDRAYETRAGKVDLKIPKLGSGSYFPRLSRATAYRRKGADSSHLGSLYPRNLDTLSRRAGQGNRHERRLENTWTCKFNNDNAICTSRVDTLLTVRSKS